MYRCSFLPLIGLLLTVSADLFAQRNRDVLWVHGRNETNDFWENYAAAFENDYARLSSTNNSYVNNDLWQMMRATNPAGIERISLNPNPIAVGHSMGGNAIVHVSINFPNRFAGIITVGSPIRGSRVANNARNGSVDRAFRKGASALTAGPGGLFEVISGGVIADELLHQIKGALQAHIRHDDAAALQLEENSTYINDLTDDTPTIPRLAIWGNEQRPVLWRLAGTSIQNARGVSMGRLPTFRTDENRLVRTVKTIQGVYLGYVTTLSAATGVGIFLGPLGWIASGATAYRAAQWRRGYNYLRKDAESDWNNLIGANRWETRTIRYWQQDCATQKCWSTCRNTGRWVTTTRRIQINEPSDGFIHKSSQIGANTHFDKGKGYYEREAEGANHLEQNRHDAVRNRLISAFEGTDPRNVFSRR